MSPSRIKPPALVHLDRERCLDLERSLATEWLETDGLGGYASSTPACCPTRRYHGLLVTRPAGASARHLFLARYDETLERPEGALAFSMARYGDVFAPEGWQAIEAFRLAPWPVASYRLDGLELTREVLLVRGAPTVLCRYRLEGDGEPCVLSLRPLLPYRPVDALTMRNDVLDDGFEPLRGGLRVQPYRELPALSITAGDALLEFRHEPVWYRDLFYSADAARGYDASEDQFSPGVLRLALGPGGEVVVAATLADPVATPAALWRREAAERERCALEVGDGPVGRLALGAEDFLYRTPAGRWGVDAGYPWFGEWGRDTFVALPGLTLARGERERCRRVLDDALPYLRDGLLPNLFGGGPDDSHYDSADAALWFARAALLYEQDSGERAFVLERLFPALDEIARAHRDGTRMGIRCDEHGLLRAGDERLNPTWMDARTSAGPVTPRDGFAVELNALWYSLVAHLEALCEARGDAAGAGEWRALRRGARRAFVERFWLPDEERLADRWKGGAADRSLRPNMVIAAALEHSPLTRAQRGGVVAAAERELLTPRGLRTLATWHPDYHGRYQGGPEERDEAYHQGTVWPWLFGFHVEASLRAFGRGKGRLATLRAVWDELATELDGAGLGHVSEVFDGNAPHRPGGTIAQAWNTAELLRAHALLENGLP